MMSSENVSATNKVVEAFVKLYNNWDEAIRTCKREEDELKGRDDMF